MCVGGCQHVQQRTVSAECMSCIVTVIRIMPDESQFIHFCQRGNVDYSVTNLSGQFGLDLGCTLGYRVNPWITVTLYQPVLYEAQYEQHISKFHFLVTACC